MERGLGVGTTISIDMRNLRVTIGGNDILKGVDFMIEKNESVGIVGESGSGKTMLVRSLTGLLPIGARLLGDYRIDGADFPLDANEGQWRRIRGSEIGMVMQDPFTALDPCKKCGRQITDGLPAKRRRGFDIAAALAEVRLPGDSAERYPFQLSGGQRQRVVIAAALATEPALLVADEATTALDVITQQEILDLIENIRRTRGMPLILITHNIRLARQRTDRIFVMDGGVVAETGPTAEVIENPKDERTRALLAADRFLRHSPYASDVSGKDVLLSVGGLSKSFGKTKALDNVSLEVCVGESVGIVGQSGSGKTTLARCLVGLARPDSGGVNYYGRGSPQIVFQDPYSSLNPCHTVRYILEEALEVSNRPISELSELLSLAEIPEVLLSRRPAGLSGGQRQRVAIARALAPRPELLICDEAVSSLDVVVQNQILATLERLKDERELAILFITHDLSVLRMIAGRVYVMNKARIVESGPAEQIFESARDEYTRRLVEASAVGGRSKHG